MRRPPAGLAPSLTGSLAQAASDANRDREGLYTALASSKDGGPQSGGAKTGDHNPDLPLGPIWWEE